MRTKRKVKRSSENQKVKNATVVVVDGITFRSKLEAYCYAALKEAGIPALYEEVRFTTLDPFKYNDEDVPAITYKPDFVGKDFIIECKGNMNDAFPVRWKLFKYFLYMNKLDYKLYMPRNQKQVREVVNKIKKDLDNGE